MSKTSITIPLTRAERDEINIAAIRAGMKQATWCRAVLISALPDQSVINLEATAKAIESTRKGANSGR